MRQRIITALAALVCFAVGYAGNISVGAISLKPGETKDLKISLSSAVTEMVGVQFDVTLPDGFSLESIDEKVYKLSSNQTSDMTCNVSDLGNNAFRFVMYSGTLQKLKAGDLMSLNLKVNNTKSLGSYSVSLSNVVFSDNDGNTSKETGTSAAIKVTNFFTLLYKVDGVDYKLYQVEYGETITPETAPTKEGNTFSGWSEIPETMPAKDVTVTGTFAINQYTITYKIDDEVYQTENVDYGSMITPPNAPEREGYTFEWIDVPETMPAHDITIIGSYTSGINAIRMDAENGKVFDLNGRQVKTPGKGVYIINGRKVVIK